MQRPTDPLPLRQPRRQQRRRSVMLWVRFVVPFLVPLILVQSVRSGWLRLPRSLLDRHQCLPGVNPPCDCFEPQRNVTWSQLLGTWYLVEAVSENPSGRDDMCAGMVLSRTADPAVFSKAAFEAIRGEKHFTNTSIYSTVPYTWLEDELGYYTHAAFLTWDNATLGLVSCVPILDIHYQWAGILTRDPLPSQSQLDHAHERLREANLTHSSQIFSFNNTQCNF